MTYNYGDKVTLENLGEYVVFDVCNYENKEYMALVKKEQSEMIMVEVKTEDDLEILDDKDYIKNIVEKMMEEE